MARKSEGVERAFYHCMLSVQSSILCLTEDSEERWGKFQSVQGVKSNTGTRPLWKDLSYLREFKHMRAAWESVWLIECFRWIEVLQKMHVPFMCRTVFSCLYIIFPVIRPGSSDHPLFEKKLFAEVHNTKYSCMRCWAVKNYKWRQILSLITPLLPQWSQWSCAGAAEVSLWPDKNKYHLVVQTRSTSLSCVRLDFEVNILRSKGGENLPNNLFVCVADAFR